jgi:hypothetical protein
VDMICYNDQRWLNRLDVGVRTIHSEAGHFRAIRFGPGILDRVGHLLSAVEEHRARLDCYE